MKKWFFLGVLIFAAGNFAIVSGGDSPAGSPDRIKQGALLYDNWPAVTGQTPPGSHPLYPEASKKQGKSSWRCKECHGWDYAGHEGRYKSGSHYTGIKGVLDAALKNPAELTTILTDTSGNHDFSPYLSSDEILSLVTFLRYGLRDFSAVAASDGSGLGNAGRGAGLYSKNCASCHGGDGDAIDFKDKDGVQGISWAALGNPQETIHKIRWGHPGSDMPSLITDSGLKESDAVDILTWCQQIGNTE